ncbi:MAG: HD domain-containing protein [Chloroflexi bacterium]|nr:HD domain-containing protein [Chloroflexota bacterium]
MENKIEEKLKFRVKPLLEKGRKGDWQHTLRALDYARYLLRYEAGEEDIVLSALYLHDIGWGRVDYSDFENAPFALKKDARSVHLHMRYGAEMAAEILEEMRYDPEKIRVITSIVAAHDIPDKVFTMDNPSAILVMEADRMDRYGPESLKRLKQLFGEKALDEERMEGARALRIDGLDEWFKTPTAKDLAKKLGRETGWFK